MLHMRRGASNAGTAAVLGAVLLSTAGCTHGATGPKPDAFTPGSCRTAAVAVLDVGRVIRPILGHPGKADAAAAALTSAQDRLRAAQRTQRKDAGRLTPLVAAIGYYRMTVIGHTYTEATGRAVESAQRAVVAACTTS